MPYPHVPLAQSFEFKEAKKFKDDVSVYAKQFEEWYISNKQYSCEVDVTEAHPLMLLMDPNLNALI